MKKCIFFVNFLVFGFSIVFAQNISQYQQEIKKIISDFQAGNITVTEMENRSSVLTADITSGNIREDARNDIEWRRQWVTRLTETENYFNEFFKTNSLPYTLFYSAKIKQGAINYQTETMTLNMDINLHGFTRWLLPIEQALRAVYKALNDGLDETGRKTDWGLNKWPQQSITNFNLFERRSQSFNITAELVNSQNKIIGRQDFQVGGNWQVLLWNNRINTQISNDDRKIINFTNVKVDDITDNLTIRITRINGVDAQTASRNRVLQIKALNENEWEANAIYSINKGAIIGLNGKGGELIIPETIWDDLVIAIGAGGSTMSGYYPLRNINVTSIIIPDTVTIIRYGAFSGSKLTHVSIGNGVTIIEEDAFRGNNLSSVIIGSGVKSIGVMAFQENPLTSITIGANVELSDSSFGYSIDSIGFVNAYNNGRKLAGTYTRQNADRRTTTWTRR